MVVAADDVGDAHVVVVHHHRLHVGRRAVAAQHDHVVQLGVGDRAPRPAQGPRPPSRRRCGAFSRIDRRDARRRLRSDRGRASGRRSAAAALGLLPARASRRAPRACSSSGRRCPRPAAARATSAWRAARANWKTRRRPSRRPSQSRPSRIAVDRRLGGALAVGVLDAQQELAAVWRANSQLNSAVRAPPICSIAGGRGGETGDDGHDLPQLSLKSAR